MTTEIRRAVLPSTAASHQSEDERFKRLVDHLSQLHELSTHLVNGGGIEALFERVLDTAVHIMHSDAASMQLSEPTERGTTVLRLLAHRGFHAESVLYWQLVESDGYSTCAAALRNDSRVWVSDVEQCEDMKGTADLLAYRQCAIRAAQSTPLKTRSGRLLGVISTHWREPHEPSKPELQAFDILARQVADLLERKQSEDALREADQRKDEFLATLAHELRNPLAPIRNAMQVLARMGARGQTETWCRNVIERQLEHMARLLDDLLDVSRISRGHLWLRKTRVTLASVLDSATETSNPLIVARGHELAITLPPEPVWVDADPVRLAQVFSNLLNNAAKYTPQPGQIRLSAVLNPENSREVVVSVRDTGLGIGREMLPHLFQMFYRGQAASAVQDGLGIGLALGRAVVDMHGGTLSARSEGEGRGSEFLVRLPIVISPQQAEFQESSTEELPAGTADRILVVDDNRDAADSLAVLLKLDGVETLTANDGAECLEKAAGFRPDVILLDLGLPEMSGYEVCRRIRECPWGGDIVVIALSGWGRASDQAKSKEAGFNGHLVKPVEHAKLRELIKKRLAR